MRPKQPVRKTGVGQELLSRVPNASGVRKKAITSLHSVDFLRRKLARPNNEALSVVSRRDEEAKERNGDGNNVARVMPPTKNRKMLEAIKGSLKMMAIQQDLYQR